ncbi:MAG TPA: sialidase family protein [Streptosporangiaceae bacterium]|nr:sialidase family protein [Streptosporangiaceae bacterium]
MTRLRHTGWSSKIVTGMAVMGLTLTGAGSATAAQHGTQDHRGSSTSRASTVIDVSQGCSGGNAEVEAATAAPDYVYDVWIGCGGIGFARSTDGGATFSKPITVPGSVGSQIRQSWDPSVAVAPDGTLYLAYMRQLGGFAEPVVAASFDHGATFPQVTADTPPVNNNWGDRDFIAAGANGVVYLTWDYGPSASLIKFICSPTGSCSFSAGDVNAVVQKSTDGGKTFGPITPMGPNFPRNGGIAAPVIMGPNGGADVLYLGHVVDSGTYKLHPGHEFFTSSADGTTWPAHPLELFPGQGPIALKEWWIDVDLSADSGGTLYAIWDTQTTAGDIGWLTWSSDGGTMWSTPVRVTPDNDHAVHIMEVAGGAPGTVYVGWQTDASPKGYATWERPYSVTKGWLGPAVRVSPQFGNAQAWPGDTFGIAPLPSGGKLAMSWGSAVGTSQASEIWATTLTPPAR